MRHGVIARAHNGNAAVFELAVRRAEVLGTLAYFKTYGIEPRLWFTRSRRHAAHFYEQKLMMRAPAGKRRHPAPAVDLRKPQRVAIKPGNLLKVAYIQNHMPQFVDFHRMYRSKRYLTPIPDSFTYL